MLAHAWLPYANRDGRIIGGELKVWLHLPASLPPIAESRINALMEHIDNAWGSEAVDGAR